MRERETGRDIKPVRERARQGHKACERESQAEIKPVRERARQGHKACEREREQAGT